MSQWRRGGLMGSLSDLLIWWSVVWLLVSAFLRFLKQETLVSPPRFINQNLYTSIPSRGNTDTHSCFFLRKLMTWLSVLLGWVCLFVTLLIFFRYWLKQVRIHRFKSVQEVACTHKVCSYKAEMLHLMNSDLTQWTPVQEKGKEEHSRHSTQPSGSKLYPGGS